MCQAILYYDTNERHILYIILCYETIPSAEIEDINEITDISLKKLQKQRSTGFDETKGTQECVHVFSCKKMFIWWRRVLLTIKSDVI